MYRKKRIKIAEEDKANRIITTQIATHSHHRISGTKPGRTANRRISILAKQLRPQVLLLKETRQIAARMTHTKPMEDTKTMLLCIMLHTKLNNSSSKVARHPKANDRAYAMMQTCLTCYLCDLLSPFDLLTLIIPEIPSSST